MSAALVEPVVAVPKAGSEGPKLVLPAGEIVPLPAPAKAIEKRDPNPLAPVFIIGGLALITAFAFVGSIVMWLLLRHSGVMAP